jgi:ribose/xylose/arabinose/galactoside ABC-type transport system permease subunit
VTGREAAVPAGARFGAASLRVLLSRYGVWLAILALVVIAAILSPAFLTPINLLNVVRQASVVGIAAVGLTFVVLVRGVDVSIAGVITATATLAAAIMAGSDANIPLAVGACLAFGLAVGLFNGLLVIRNVHPFILTLGVGVVLLGATQFYTGGTSLGIPAPSFRTVLNARIEVVPVLALVFLVIGALGIALVRFTRFGHRLVLVGANPRAAFLSGVRVNGYIVAAYALSGLTASLAGLALLARSGPPSNFTGMGLEFEALAAVILGGTTFAGGVGGVGGSIAGALAIGLAFNLVNILGLPFSAQQLVRGGVIIVIASVYAIAQRSGAEGR